jgi:hypothetical protein
MGVKSMYGDKECMFTAIKVDGSWWVTSSDIRPHRKHIQRHFGITEHQASNWFEADLERAENVVRIRAWFDAETALAWELGYCEKRLEKEDFEALDQRVISYWEIPF